MKTYSDYLPLGLKVNAIFPDGTPMAGEITETHIIYSTSRSLAPYQRAKIVGRVNGNYAYIEGASQNLIANHITRYAE